MFIDYRIARHNGTKQVIAFYNQENQQPHQKQK